MAYVVSPNERDPEKQNRSIRNAHERATTAEAAIDALEAAEYLVGSANSALSAERVVTDTDTITWDLSTPGQAKANKAAPPAFSVHKNGTAQTGIADSTFTTITWSTEEFDIGDHFASNGWTPPAGVVYLTATMLISGTFPAGAQVTLSVFKDDINYKAKTVYSGAANLAVADINLVDICDGTNTYTLRLFVDVSSSTATVSGNSANTHWSGYWVGPDT